MKLQPITVNIPPGKFTFADLCKVNPHVTHLTLRKFISLSVKNTTLARMPEWSLPSIIHIAQSGGTWP